MTDIETTHYLFNFVLMTLMLHEEFNLITIILILIWGIIIIFTFMENKYIIVPSVGIDAELYMILTLAIGGSEKQITGVIMK